MKDIHASIHKVIGDYRLVSTSKLLLRLNEKNEKVITEAIIANKQQKYLLELIKKRDHYASKIHELLNVSGEQLDPMLIDNDLDAEHYIRRRFMKNQAKVLQVKSLIQKHTKFLKDSGQEHDRIMKKFETKPQTYNGLEKLSSLKKESERNQSTSLAKELQELYAKVADTQRLLSKESEATLKTLEVPFFCLEIHDTELEKHKQFILDLLYKLYGESVSV